MDEASFSTSKSNFDGIEVEYFERRLYEIVRSAKGKQEEIDKISSQLLSLKNSARQKYLEHKFHQQQWTRVIHKHYMLRDFNYKLKIDSERSNLKDRLARLRSNIPALEEENQSLLYKNLQLELAKHALCKEIENLNGKLTRDGEERVTKVEDSHGNLVRELSLLKEQLQSLKRAIHEGKSRKSSQTEKMHLIKARKEYLRGAKSQLARDLCSLQISRLASRVPQGAGPASTASEDKLRNNQSGILQDLRDSIHQEVMIREQLKRQYEELKQIQDEDLAQYVVATPSGGYVVATPSGGQVYCEGGGSEGGNPHETDPSTELNSNDFNLDDYLIFEED